MSRQACAGKLKLIREAAQLYGAGSVLPFASHFSLWHPTHRHYQRLMKRNTLADVKSALAGIDVEVIDLLPGETWNVGKGVIHRSEDRDDWFDPPSIASYIEGAVDEETFASHHPADESLSRWELEQYLERLNRVPDIANCEDLTVRIQAPSSRADRALDVAIEVAAGHLRILESAPDVPNLTIEIPLAVLTDVIRNERSWDEAFIGYWCRFDRHPNVYHAGFWRLLQAPYLKRRTAAGEATRGIGPGSTIAELLEAYGPEADRILRRHGLYCLGCHHSTAESLEMASRQHGIDARRLEHLVRELNAAFGSEVVS
jgi:CMP-N-acetylneuraminate monooxygenase